MAGQEKRRTPEQLAAHPPGQTRKKNQKTHGSDIPFLILVLALVCFGLIMLFSATYAYSYYKTGGADSYAYIRQQALFAVFGVVAMLGISLIPYHLYRKLMYVIFGGAFGLLVITLFMPAVNGAQRWIFFGGISFQPSEIMKFAMAVTCAWLIDFAMKKQITTKKGVINGMQTFQYGVLPFVAPVLLVAVVMMLQPHTSGTILIVSIAALMMLVGGTRLRWFMLAGGAGVGALAAFILSSERMAYVIERLKIWQDPFLDAQDAGFQTVQSLYAIGSGGFFGVGIGNSKQKHLFIPEPQNDFIFSIVCEELGFLGAFLVIALFALLIWRGLVISIKAKDRFGSLLAFGLTMQVGLQALLNIAVVTNTVPNTGISLPFFSYGGTSLLMLLGEMGVILNISKTAALRRT